MPYQIEVEMEEPTKQVVDMLSIATVLGTLSTILPPLSALLSIIWISIRIWETDTVKQFTNRMRKRDDKGRFVKDDD
jgi:hypothetical protein